MKAKETENFRNRDEAEAHIYRVNEWTFLLATNELESVISKEKPYQIQLFPSLKAKMLLEVRRVKCQG